MATINQLVRKGRKDKTKKSKSPVLNIGYNSKDKLKTNNCSLSLSHLQHLINILLTFVILTNPIYNIR